MTTKCLTLADFETTIVDNPIVLVDAARLMRKDKVHFILAGEGDQLPSV